MFSKKYNGSRRNILRWVSSKNFLRSVNSLICISGAEISKTDIKYPDPFTTGEVELRDFLRENFDPAIAKDLEDWWLGSSIKKYLTPKWDLISTCTIAGQKGILLVESKAHWDELKTTGKIYKQNYSKVERMFHKKICNAIEGANYAISIEKPGVSITPFTCYQLSSHISHAYFLAQNGIPVVLLYLGFVNASYKMKKIGLKPFRTKDDWQTCFRNAAKLIGADILIDETIPIGKTSFTLLCESLII
ncbi:hypothetical protein BH10BAC5_BH10BAC5_24000 [soil metagenome]